MKASLSIVYVPDKQGKILQKEQNKTMKVIVGNNTIILDLLRGKSENFVSLMRDKAHEKKFTGKDF